MSSLVSVRDCPLYRFTRQLEYCKSMFCHDSSLFCQVWLLCFNIVDRIFWYNFFRFWMLQLVWLPGESTVELQKAFLEDRPVWYRLEDPRQLRGGGKISHSSPRGSLANEIAQRLLRKAEFGQQRSFSGLFSPH